MKTFIASVVLAASLLLHSQTASSISYRIAGGVIVTLTVGVNPEAGTSVVLPIGIQLCHEVTNSPLWYTTFNFGTSVKLLPRLNIMVPTNYDSGGKFYVESLVSSNRASTTWVTNFVFCTLGVSSEAVHCGPCEIYGYDNHMGVIAASLFDGSNTNGFYDWETQYQSITNSIMGRFGLGACDTRFDNYASRTSVAFVYFNLPPRPSPREGRWCQPAESFMQYPYESSWCGYTTNYPPGFILGSPNRDNTQNWPYYPYPCKPGAEPTNFYRVKYETQMGN